MSKYDTPSEGRDGASLRERVARNLRAHARMPLGRHSLILAAVAVALVRNRHGEDCFVLTRRTKRRRAHGGQWALPGGRVDEGETAVVAALRELAEEVGLASDSASVLGVLDDYPTRSGYAITPVVVWCGAGEALRGNSAEVAEVHRVPLSELLKPEVPRLRQIAQSDRPVISIPLLGVDIHAPTAAVLYQFREVALLARSTRVVHYEQPVFAWR